MARGVYELRTTLAKERGDSFQFSEVTSIHEFLDKFYMSRIGKQSE